MSHIKKYAPRRRFEKFSNADDWEQRKFIEIINRLSKTSNSSILPKVEYEDIIAEEGRLNKDISNKFDSRKGILFQPKNILYGKLRPYLKNWLYPDFKGVAVGDFWVFEAIEATPRFIYNLIQSDSYQKVANDTAGTKMPRSDWTKVSNSSFFIPKESSEQKRIGTFFKQLDDTIALHQRKLEKIKALKTAYLSEMFPAEGETKPKRRFGGFTDDWEQRKFSQVADIFDGTHQTPKYTDFGVKFVSVENIATMETKKYISQEAYDKEYSNKKVEQGDVLMTRIGDVGTAKVIETDEPLAYYVTLALLKPKGIDPDFLAQQIASPEVQRSIWKRTLHIAFPKKINLGEINQVSIFIPDLEEQVEIGIFFKQLDKTITIHQRKLQKLQNIKKAYLNEMFI
ncbi:restriction endonuclease subunit S [Listeria monocytogenes]|uniref:restriction endonuclease subunit S n=1 Tax=Listeria monocytogenes TaxID=1639 RepID=UPI000BE12E25|nr:restriction endonuclease subunit S [Listeria monocytogenes]PDE49168.1 restriction endonuclease subunit S [Listeria monocytogenes]